MFLTAADWDRSRLLGVLFETDGIGRLVQMLADLLLPQNTEATTVALDLMLMVMSQAEIDGQLGLVLDAFQADFDLGLLEAVESGNEEVDTLARQLLERLA
jgi:hypothetical protein